MKIGISYSLFDGEELLKRSVETLRECGVDYVNIIWQKISYFGQPASEGIEDLLADLVRSKLVDELLHYAPKYSGKPAFTLYTTKFAKMDELAKRNLGLELARQAGCSHFLSIDADEFYFPRQFRAAAKFIQKNDIDYSVVEIQPYHLKPTFALHPVRDNLHVPFIFNIEKWPDCWLEYDSMSFPQSCYTDTTRRVNMTLDKQRLHIFPRDEILMHHMRTVRKSLCRKYTNSTHFQSANARRVQRLLLQAREMKGVFEGTISEVENHFNIHIDPSDPFVYNKPYRTWQTPVLWVNNFISSKLFKPLERTIYR